jgi:hypothetical protein
VESEHSIYIPAAYMEYIEELEDIKNQNPYIEEGQTTQ